MQIRTKVIYRGNSRDFIWNAWLDEETSKWWFERIKSYTVEAVKDDSKN